MSGGFESHERYELICRHFEDEGQSVCVEDEGLSRIYIKNNGELWVVVDPQDFRYFSKWKWSWSSTPRGKLYAQRSTGGNSRKHLGMSMRAPSHSLYLHREIMLRTGRVQPTPDHKIVDHRNGNSLYCRRANLRWATISMNNTNKVGSEERSRQLEYLARHKAA